MNEEISAAETLAELKNKKKDDSSETRVNLCVPAVEVEPPKRANLFVTADANRITHMLNKGSLRKVAWRNVKADFQLCAGQLLNRPAKIIFDKHVPAINKEIVPVDVDKLLEEKSADGYVLHDDHLVHVCTFSAKACKAVHQVAMSETGIKLEFTELALQGTQEIGNTDKNQKDEVAVCTANFGATEFNWMQPAARHDISQS